jgi:hypothetical protein
LWVYLRDDRPHAGLARPEVLYRYSPDRKGEHPRVHLACFRRCDAAEATWKKRSRRRHPAARNLWTALRRYR